MYTPPAFVEERPEVLAGLIRSHSFATLVSNAGGEPAASHLPLLYEAEPGVRGVLRGHMARSNPQWRGFREEEAVLAIFHGPHAYISPSWYASEQAVPTWNYAAVHAYGTPRLIEHGPELRRLLEDMVRVYEAPLQEPWSMDRLPEAFVEGLVKAIVGFEIRLTRLEGKLKMSQNRPAADREGALAGLERQGDAEALRVAEWMRRLTA